MEINLLHQFSIRRRHLLEIEVCRLTADRPTLTSYKRFLFRREKRPDFPAPAKLINQRPSRKLRRNRHHQVVLILIKPY